MTRETEIAFARRLAAERAENSSAGMRLKAQGLRSRVDSVANPSDQAAMLRLATDLELRANELEKRGNPSPLRFAHAN